MEDTWDVYQINDVFELVECERGLVMLSGCRQDLLTSLGGLTPEDWDTLQPGECRSIYAILMHNAGVERWYLDRLGLAFPWILVPDDPFARLEFIRAELLQVRPLCEVSRANYAVHVSCSARLCSLRLTTHTKSAIHVFMSPIHDVML